MVSVSSPYPLPLRTPIRHFRALSNQKCPQNQSINTSFHVLPRGVTAEGLGSVSSGGKPDIICCKNSEEHHREPFFRVEEECVAKRREFLVQIAVFTATFPLIIPEARAENDEPENFRVYTDDVNKFKILIPQDWQVGAGEPNGFKSITAFYPEGASSSNVSVVITGLGPDFTRMGSLGKVEAFADTLVSGLDRSWQRPPGVAAKLIDCKAANGFYYIEYWLQNPGESRRHLFSAIGMSSNGWYNRLYTVTGQFTDEESEKYGSKIEKAVGSFRFV